MALVLVALPANAQTYRSDATALQLAGFGGATVIGDGDVIVGSVGQTTNTGEVYVFRDVDGEWQEAARLSASDGETDNRFGRAMALDGNTLLIGATVQDANKGAVYVFNKDADGNWVESSKMIPESINEGDNYGRVLSVSGDFAYAATIGRDEGKGAVYGFHRNDDGEWMEKGMLLPEGLESGDYFGLSISAYGDRVIVGAPAFQRQDYAGAAYIFKFDAGSGTWKQEAKLEDADLGGRSGYGSAAVLYENFAIIGAPGVDQFKGKVYIYAYDEATEEWSEQQQLTAFDAASRANYGNTIKMAGNSLWIGAPFASQGTGAVYVHDFDFESMDWMGVSKIRSSSPRGNAQFGNSFAVSGDMAIIGSEGADGGEGRADVFMKNEAGNWVEKAVVYNELEGMDAVVGSQVDCEEGGASIFGCDNVDLLSFLPLSELGGGRGASLNDIWGWTDPETGTEYALVGRVDGTSFVDISNPHSPAVVGNLWLTEGANPASWRDIKVYKDHAFIVSDGAGQHGMQVFDLTQLRDVDAADMPVEFEETAHYDQIASAHNIVINEDTGFAYAVGSSSGGITCGGGLHIIDIREPLQPTHAGCFADEQTGRASTGYTHDAQCVVYQGPDTEHQGKEICFNANETALSIGDVSDKANTVALSRADYPNVGYSHQGWLTEDHKYFYMNDELDELQGKVNQTRTLIWDVQDLDDPQLVKEFFLESESSDHNLYIRGNLMYQSNYHSGLRILDITDIENPVEVGFFDTMPYGENGPGFDGSWSNYPYFKSGIIAVSSIGQGLFLVKKSDIDI